MERETRGRTAENHARCRAMKGRMIRKPNVHGFYQRAMRAVRSSELVDAARR
jgi:hypothetical protein